MHPEVNTEVGRKSNFAIEINYIWINLYQRPNFCIHKSIDYTSNVTLNILKFLTGVSLAQIESLVLGLISFFASPFLLLQIKQR